MASSPHAFNCSDSQWSSLNDRKWNHIRQDFDCIRPLIIPSYDEKRILEEIDNHPPEIQFSDHFFPMTTTQHSVFSLSNIPVEDLDKAIENESFNSVFIKESCFDQSHSNDNIVVVNSLNTTSAGVDQSLVDGTPLDPVLDSTHETLSTENVFDPPDLVPDSIGEVLSTGEICKSSDPAPNSQQQFTTADGILSLPSDSFATEKTITCPTSVSNKDDLSKKENDVLDIPSQNKHMIETALKEQADKYTPFSSMQFNPLVTTIP